ncbi:TPR-like protein [Gymnopus androsaceus JB14]|uniref:TPR-like protein n=1 Tax=Gymnopus androsaceus JB14 TaxID=1447944 RepID=A0A6A4H2V5_9AGAR|nr:TPR-like protein [Gymnopus androsaceus JB14]
MSFHAHSISGSEMASSSQMFAGASSFEIRNSIFTTGNVTYHPQAANLGHASISISNILQCPSPSQYFVGREDTLEKLSKIFSAPVVTVWSTNIDVLKDFVRHRLKYSSIFLDASSSQALDKSIAENITQVTSGNTLLVLQNPSAPVEEYLDRLPYAPVLAITTQSSGESSTAFQLPDYTSQQEVNQLLHSIENALDPGQRVVTLIANGGTGKTQTALHFVSKNFSRYSNVWFFDASSHDTLTANFKEFGNAAGIGEAVKNVREFLARMHQNWLCIFDNADDETIFLKNYIPICNHGNVIVTSRLSETSQMASPGCQIDLMDLTKESAMELLLSHAHEQSTLENQNLASKIVEALGCHALAVSTAGAYIGATPTCALQNYLTHFNKKKKRILNYKMRSLDSYQSTIFSAFHLSFEKLSHPTQLLMQICAYLNPTAIPLEIFTRAAAFTGSDVGPVDLDPPTKAINFMMDFLSVFAEVDSWEDSVNELCQLSLASYNYLTKSMAFHPVIHTCACETIAHVGEDGINQVAALLLGRAIPLEFANDDYVFRCQLVIQASHIYSNHLPTILVCKALAQVFADSGFWSQSEKLREQVLQLHEQVIGDQYPDTLLSMANLAVTYCQCGKLELAEKLGEEVLQLRKQVIGNQHPDTLLSMASLAVTYRKCGKLRQAEKLEEEVLQLCKQVIGDQHPDTLRSMANLANTYRNCGKLKQAEKLEEEVLHLRKQVIGGQHPDTLRSMANLAATYGQLGKLKQAEKLEEEVLQLRKQVIGDQHPDTLKSMANLAVTYLKCGKLKQAEKLEEEVLHLRKQVIGGQHPDTLKSMANLAATYGQLGKLKQAEMLEEEVLQLCKQVIGDQHPDTLKSMANLAATYGQLGKLKQAEMLEKEVLQLRKQVIGEQHPDTLTSMANLAATYGQLGKLKQAEMLEKEVLQLRKQVIGEQHPDTLTSMANLAVTYGQLGKLKQAEKLEEEVLQLCKQVIGDQHPDTLRSMANLANTYRNCGKLKQAEKLEEEVLHLCKQVIGGQHPDTLRSMANLAATYRKCGKLELAEKLEEEVLQLRKQVIGDQHPDTLNSMANLAGTYRKCGKLELAEKLGEEVLQLRKQVIGDQHPDTLNSMANLAVTYRKCGKLELAEKLGEEALQLRKQVIGDQHPDTLRSMANVAATYGQLGKLKQAEKLQEEVLQLCQQVVR